MIKRVFNRRTVMSHLRAFLHQEAAGGSAMILAALLALFLANSAQNDAYQTLIRLPLLHGFTVSGFVSDVLMPLFFLLIGMELKREMAEGFLSQKGQKILPLVAALGGIVLPALIYRWITSSTAEYATGWAIPTATDIAFAVCILSLLGKRVPPGAKIFLLAIAIYDDLAAILIIALFYSGGVALAPLLAAAIVMLLLALLNRKSVASLWPYLAFGAGLWFCLHSAHIHTTVAGMITGLFIPLAAGEKKPLAQLMQRLHAPVAFLILPIFAFTSAGISFASLRAEDIFAPLPLGIALGLFIGKPLGILGATYAAVKCGLASKPEDTSWRVLYGIATIAGIGFTMSLFIGFLAFPDEALQDTVKLGVLTGSLASALCGFAILHRALRKSGR